MSFSCIGGIFAGIVVVGGIAVKITGGSLSEFFENIRKWLGDDWHK